MKLRLLVSAAFVVIAALVVVDAFAEDAPPAPAQVEKAAPPAAPAPQRYYLELEPADLDVISKALVEMPFRLANPLLLKMNGQLRAQDQLKEAADKAISDPVEKAKKRK